MSVYYPPVQQHENLIRAALRVIGSTHYGRPEDPHASAEQEYSDEQLALAARALVEAVNAKPADEQPIGWVRDEAQQPAEPKRPPMDPVRILGIEADAPQQGGGA